jgi:hypothetical protein
MVGTVLPQRGSCWLTTTFGRSCKKMKLNNILNGKKLLIAALSAESAEPTGNS